MLHVHSVETFGTHEGPGIRFVLFLQGCMFRCLYCHNPDTQNLHGGTLMSTEELLTKIEGQREYFSEKGGVTASGGEPTLQALGLADLFKELQRRGIHTALDTCGGRVVDEEVKQLLTVTNLVLLDIKHIDAQKHKLLTGRGNEHVLAFATYCEENNVKMWLRHVLVPGYTDDEEDLKNWARHFAGYKSVERAEILPYHTLGVHKYKKLGKPYKLEGVRSPTKEEIAKAKELFQRYLPNVYVR